MALLEIDLDSQLDLAVAWTKEHERQLPFSVSQALNATAQGSKFIPGSKDKSILSELAKTAPQFLDRPKKVVATGARATTAKKRNLEVSILPKDRPFSRARTLEGNFLGGTRAPKDFEAKFSSLSKGTIATSTTYSPTRFAKPVDKYGNVSRSAIDKIIKNVGTTGRSKTGNVFIGTPRGGTRPAGVYRRERNEKLRPLFFVNTPIDYKQRFPIGSVAIGQVNLTFAMYLRRQLTKNVNDRIQSKRRGSF